MKRLMELLEKSGDIEVEIDWASDPMGEPEFRTVSNMVELLTLIGELGACIVHEVPDHQYTLDITVYDDWVE